MENRDYYLALQDFSRARRMATIQQILSRFTGQSTDLLSYEDVRKGLRATEGANRELKEIPLKAIVGSVGRYTDFTRDFLPRQSIDQQRWARVKAKTYSGLGLDPIEVYQIGEAYFVQDGNHRVSIARQLGSEYIQAYVRFVKTEVPFSPDDQPDDLILKSEYAEFLAKTRINQRIPDSEIRVTEPGRYLSILQQIDAVRFARELKSGKRVSRADAVSFWHKEIYLPIVEIIREQKLLDEFPGRTETDLFLWVIKYRYELEKTAGWQVQTSAAASELATRFGDKKRRDIRRWFPNIYARLLPEQLKGPAKAGLWRKRRMAAQEGRLFADILVVATEDEQICDTLEQALQIARLEGSRVHGLVYAKSNRFQTSGQGQIRSEFIDQCEAAKILGEIHFETGNPRKILQNRIRLVDLVVLPGFLLFPTDASKSIHADFRHILRRSISPILVTQGAPRPLERILLAYDGSPKAEQALYLSAFMATFWEVSLDVLSVMDTKRMTSEIPDKARAYLDHYGVNANLIQTTGDTVARLLSQIEASQSNLLILGGDDHWNIRHAVFDRFLDQLLVGSEIPVLICN